MSILYHLSIRSKTLGTVPVLHHVCACNTLLSQKYYVPTTSKQRRSASYYTFPLFTGAQYLLENLHDYTLLPWWCTIIGTTFILRTAVTLPLAIKQQKIIAKMELLKPELKEIQEAVKHNVIGRGKRDGKDMMKIRLELIRELRSYRKDFYKLNNVSPLKLYMLPWVQLPLWITISFALRNICGFTYLNSGVEPGLYPPSPGIETEGALWLTNLAVADPHYILPAILLITNLLNIELNALRKKEPGSLDIWLSRLFRGLSLMIFMMSTQVPAAMSLYWASSSTYGLAQNIMLKFPKVRRKLAIPSTPIEPERPFVSMLDVLQVRTKRFMEIQRAHNKK